MPSSPSPEQRPVEQCDGAGNGEQGASTAAGVDPPPRYEPPHLDIPPRLLRVPPEKPTPPSHHVEANSLFFLLSDNTFFDRLARWWDPDWPKCEVEQLPDPPPWSLWMESYYSMHHPRTWELLEEDQRTDAEYFWSLSAWTSGRELGGAEQGELDSLEAELEVAAKRMMGRFQRIYALFSVRKRFIAYNRRFYPKKTDSEIISISCELEEYPPCQVPLHSVWPLPLPPPFRDPRLTPLIKLFKLPPGAPLQPYILPGIDTPYTRANAPTPNVPVDPPEYQA